MFVAGVLVDAAQHAAAVRRAGRGVVVKGVEGARPLLLVKQVLELRIRRQLRVVDAAVLEVQAANPADPGIRVGILQPQLLGDDVLEGRADEQVAHRSAAGDGREDVVLAVRTDGTERTGDVVVGDVADVRFRALEERGDRGELHGPEICLDLEARQHEVLRALLARGKAIDESS